MPYYLAAYEVRSKRSLDGVDYTCFDPPYFDTLSGGAVDVRPDPTQPGSCVLYLPQVVVDARLTSLDRDGALNEILTRKPVFTGRTIVLGPDTLQAPAGGDPGTLRRVRDVGFDEWFGMHPIRGGVTTQDTDAFTGTDATDLPTYNGKWVGQTSESSTLPAIYSNGVGIAAAPGNTRACRNAAITWPDDQWSQADMVSNKCTWDSSVRTRSAAAALTYYAAGFDNNNGPANRFVLWKWVAGTRTTLASDAGNNPAVGDTLYCEAQGTTIKGILTVGHASTLSVSDAAIASGQPGLGIFPGTQAGVPFLDNWSAGDFTTGATGWGVLLGLQNNRLVLA